MRDDSDPHSAQRREILGNKNIKTGPNFRHESGQKDSRKRVGPSNPSKLASGSNNGGR